MITRPFYKKPDIFKRTGLLLFAVMFVASMIAGSDLLAQNEDAPKGKDKSDNPGAKQHGDQNDDDPMGKKRSGPPPEVNHPEEMADHMSKMLTERLNLTGDQTTSVHDIVLAYAQNHTRENFDHKELDGKIEEVLNADQKEKFKEFIKNGPPKEGPPREGPHKEEPRGNEPNEFMDDLPAR